MWSFEEYIVGWLTYLVSVIALLAVMWRITRSIPWLHLKNSLRLASAAVLLTPALVEDSTLYWAPAWVKALLSLIFGSEDGLWPIIKIILIGVLVILLVYVLLLFAIQVYERYRLKQQ